MSHPSFQNVVDVLRHNSPLETFLKNRMTDLTSNVADNGRGIAESAGVRADDGPDQDASRGARHAGLIRLLTFLLTNLPVD